jgi:hypothetical protein
MQTLSSFLALAAVAAGTPAVSAAPPPTITERPHHTSHGSIVVEAPPAEVYAAMTDYARWPQFLTDVEWTRVQSGGPHDARVRMRTRSLGDEVTIQFDNIAGQALRFKLVDGPPGARANGVYRLVPIDGGARTRVDANLYMNVVGAAGLFVSDSKIKKLRQTKLRGDLADGAREIERRHVTGAR